MSIRQRADQLWRVIAADAAEWSLPIRIAAVLALIPFAIGAVAVAAIPFRALFRVLANEDGLVEYAQFLAVVGLVVLYAAVALRLWRAGRRAYAALFGLATLGMIFVAGEEISWGQRLLGLETPDDLEEINKQGETNLHNIGGVLAIFNIGIMIVSAICIALPIARWTVWRSARPTLERYLFVAPLALAPAFAFPFLYRAVRLAFLPEPRYVLTKLSEFAELSFYFGLAAFAALTLLHLRAAATASAGPSSSGPADAADAARHAAPVTAATVASTAPPPRTERSDQDPYSQSV